MKRLYALLTAVVVGCSGGADRAPSANDIEPKVELSTSDAELATEYVAGSTLLEAPEFFDDFWFPPSTIPGEPGDVIWASNSQLVFGGYVRRVMYHSNDTRGQPIGVTAWLGLPKEVSPETPVFSWGHGTVGMADDCAPTRTRNPATIQFFQALLNAGFIVVATDYAYLGTPGPHPYYDAATMAYSMIDAAIAAQKFAGSNGPVFFGGYSIGGRGAIFAQSLSAAYAPQLDVRGTAAFRPGVDGIAEGGNLWKTLRDSPFKGYIVMAFYGVSLAWGNEYYELDEILTAEAQGRLSILDRDCLGSVLEAFADLSGDEVFRVGLDGPLPYGGPGPADQVTDLPILVIGGRADLQASPEPIRSYFSEACGRGQAIELHWFNLGHDLTIAEDEMVLLDWLQDTLDGNGRPNSCIDGPITPPLCRDSESCFAINTADSLEGTVENPFVDVPDLKWELLRELNHAYLCPDRGVLCRSNRIEGHVTQIWRTSIPVDASGIEDWIDHAYWNHVGPEWKIWLYDKQERPGWPCGYYFQFLRYNTWGMSTILPGERSSEMYVFVTHQNQITQPPMQEIFRSVWPC